MEWSWCKEFCPEMATYNKVYKIKRGKGLLNHIKLVGDKKQVKYCEKKEREYFAQTNVGAEVIFVNGNEYNGPKNVFDVSECRVPNKYGKVIKETGLSYNEDNLDEIIGNKDLSGFSNEEIVNNILLAHYDKTDDEVLYPADFSWAPDKTDADDKSATEVLEEENTSDAQNEPQLQEKQELANEFEETSELKKEPQVEQMNNKDGEKDDNEHKEYVLPENSRLEGATSKSLGKPSSLTHNSEKRPERKRMFSKTQKQQDAEAVRTEDEKSENKEDNKVVYAEEEKRPPEPEVKRTENDMVVKNTITAEENARNIAMLKDIENQYMDARNLIDQMSDSRYRILGNKLADTMKDKTYGKTQWARQYLDVSDDVATELYAKLYNLDKQTKKFCKEVVHQVEHMGCPMCGKEWDEDVTFLRPGIHYILCPNCNAERPYEKETPKKEA